MRARLGALAALLICGCASVPRGEDGKKDPDLLLKLMVQSMEAHRRDDFAASNELLEKADALVEVLYTKSISTGVVSMVRDDRSFYFKGDPFERVMIHVVGMLNYAFLGRMDEALVEARRADDRMKAHRQRRGDDDLSEEPFARYLSGALYEAKKQNSDARIDYDKAWAGRAARAESWGVPAAKLLVAERLRLLRWTGKMQDTAALEKLPEAKSSLSRPCPAGQGEAVLVIFQGRMPQKFDKKDWGALITEFMPYEAAPVLGGIQVDSEGEAFPLDLMHDLQYEARAELASIQTGVRIRSMARNAAKWSAAAFLALAGVEIQEMGNEDVEKGDLRNWDNLPARIYVTRVRASEGFHDLKLTMQDLEGKKVGERSFEGVEFKPGNTLFIRKFLR